MLAIAIAVGAGVMLVFSLLCFALRGELGQEICSRLTPFSTESELLKQTVHSPSQASKLCNVAPFKLLVCSRHFADIDGCKSAL